MELQTAFYVIGIIFMSLMTIIILVLLAAVITIKMKIIAIQNRIEDKFHSIIEIAKTVEDLVHKFHELKSKK